MFLGLLDPDPDPLVRGMDSDPVLLLTSKNSKKYLDSYCFVTTVPVFIFENYVNAPSKCKLFFCWHLMTKIAGSGSGSGSISQRHGSVDPGPDPDPHQNVMDPQH
jgi:hypothetical protein